MEMRRRLSARHILRIHMRITPTNLLPQLEPFIARLPRTEQQLELRVILLKKRLDVSFQTRLDSMQWLQDADRRQKRRRRATLPASSQPKTLRRHYHHQAIDCGGHRAEHRDPEQNLKE